MTTAAMVLGVLPLLTASVAVGRFNMGLVIMAGIAIGTLFVVSAMYMYLAAEHSKKLVTKGAPDEGPARV